MTQAKLTPTFMDQAKAGTNAGNGAHPPGPPPLIIMPAGGVKPTVFENEPLSDNARSWVPPVATATTTGGAGGGLSETMTAGSNAVAPQPQPLKVALVGTAPSSRMLAPFNDPSWEIWACSPGNMNLLPRVTKWFEIHGNLMWPEHATYGPGYIDWLKKQPFPVYMQDGPNGTGLVPNAQPFPMRDMVAKFGPDFFTSSFAWMMALAIDMGAVEIALYGIDMASRDEYILQRPGFYFFKHVASQRGIRVSAPHESDIMQPPGLYGFSEVTPFGRKICARQTEIKQRLDQMVAERDRLNHSITYLQGAQEDLDYIHTIWLGQG